MAIMTNTRQDSILTRDVLQKIAPSVFAVSPWEKMSTRYRHVPTIDVIDILADKGFCPVRAQQSRTRIEGKGDFTKHMIRLRHVDHIGPMAVGDEFPELVITNSHDGTSAYRFNAGVFRLVCLNGMVVSSADHGSVSVKHAGRDGFEERVLDATYRVIEDAPRVAAQIAEWKQIEATPAVQKVYAETIMEELIENPSIKPESLLVARRSADRPDADGKRSVWTTFNTVQEAILKGGVRGRNPETHRQTTTRAVKAVDRDIKLNKALWTLTEKLASVLA